MKSKAAVCWDSCVFIDWLSKADASRVSRIQPIITAAMAQEVVIVASALALAEVIRCAKDGSLSDEDDQKIVAFFRNTFISLRNVDRRIAHAARELCRQPLSTGKRLPPADAIHVATALAFDGPVLHTFDEKHLIPFNEVFGQPALKIDFPSYTPPPRPSSEWAGKAVERAVRDRQQGQRGLFDEQEPPNPYAARQLTKLRRPSSRLPSGP